MKADYFRVLLQPANENNYLYISYLTLKSAFAFISIYFKSSYLLLLETPDPFRKIIYHFDDKFLLTKKGIKL